VRATRSLQSRKVCQLRVRCLQPFKVLPLVNPALLLNKQDRWVILSARKRRFEVCQIQRSEVLALQETNQIRS